jgi:hypothetical protein
MPSFFTNCCYIYVTYIYVYVCIYIFWWCKTYQDGFTASREFSDSFIQYPTLLGAKFLRYTFYTTLSGLFIFFPARKTSFATVNWEASQLPDKERNRKDYSRPCKNKTIKMSRGGEGVLIDVQGSKEPEGIVFCHSLWRIRSLSFESWMSPKAYKLKAWSSACGIITCWDTENMSLKKDIESPAPSCFSLFPGFHDINLLVVIIYHHDVLSFHIPTQGLVTRDWTPLYELLSRGIFFIITERQLTVSVKDKVETGEFSTGKWHKICALTGPLYCDVMNDTRRARLIARQYVPK